MATRLRSFSKINLGLAVGPSRPDGYHGLTTVYQTLELHDSLEIEARRADRTSIAIESDHAGVPSTRRGDAERNTIHRMLALALEGLGVAAEVRVRLQKRLPVQGGLGAGSANAATALLGLERELDVALPGAARLRIAAEVGSDVPLFLLGGTVLGQCRGEQVVPLPDGPALPVVIAAPSVGIATGRAFAELDRRMDARAGEASSLTDSRASHTLEELGRFYSSLWATTGVRRVQTGIAEDLPDRGDLAENPLLALVRTGVENDFESVAFGQHPSLCEIKQALQGSPELHSGALYAGLSGSGSALFGIFEETQAAQEAQQRVQALGIDARLTRTLPREGYFKAMFAVS